MRITVPAISWRVVTPKEQLIWPKSALEQWYMYPPLRYIVPSDQQEALEGKLAAWSELKSSKNYRELNVSSLKPGSKVLVVRHPSRGIGDLLFITGPLRYLYERYRVEVYWHAPKDRDSLIHHLPYVKNELPFNGPLSYDSLPLYDAHWFIDAVTELDEEPDQENVYDALFRQIGVDPETVLARYKKPQIVLTDADDKHYTESMEKVHSHLGFSPVLGEYIVVAPLSKSVTRNAPYPTWLTIIQKLVESGKKVILLGDVNDVMPNSGMTFGEFAKNLGNFQKESVLNLIGMTELRLAATILKNAACLVTLDTGLLYVAEALGTPAVSVWGTHDPRVRIGYNDDLMKLALWHKEACQFAPCFAYRGFPEAKCGLASDNTGDVCKVLGAVKPEAVIDLIALTLRPRASFVGKIKAGGS